MNTLVIARIASDLTRSRERFWRLWSKSGTISVMVMVFQDELEEAHWLEDEAKRLAGFMLQIPAGQEKSLNVPVVIKFLRDGRYYQVTGVVKGPESAEIRSQLPAADRDWITALASQIRDQVTQLQTTIQEQQNQIAELQNEVGDKQSRIDKLIARITVLESELAGVGADAELPGFLQRPANTPADLLTDLHVIANIIGVNESDTARLIAEMMKHDWECTLDDLKTAFRRDASVTFVNVIMDDINERAQAEINDNLMFEEDGRWEILEDYRDEIEYILTHSEYRQ